MRDEAEMQGDHAAAQQPGKVSDLLHLLRPRRTRGGWHESDGLGHRRDVRVAFALKSPEDGGQHDVQLFQASQELVGVRLGARPLGRRMQLDGWHTQLMSDFQFHTQSRINAGENTNGPLFHDSYSS